jgi:hypothetical protein
MKYNVYLCINQLNISVMHGAYEFQESLKKYDELEIVPTDIWWELIVRHKVSGRRVRICYNSLSIDYWFKGDDNGFKTGTNNMLRFDNHHNVLGYNVLLYLIHGD